MHVSRTPRTHWSSWPILLTYRTWPAQAIWCNLANRMAHAQRSTRKSRWNSQTDGHPSSLIAYDYRMGTVGVWEPSRYYRPLVLTLSLPISKLLGGTSWRWLMMALWTDAASEQKVYAIQNPRPDWPYRMVDASTVRIQFCISKLTPMLNYIVLTWYRALSVNLDGFLPNGIYRLRVQLPSEKYLRVYCVSIPPKQKRMKPHTIQLSWEWGKPQRRSIRSRLRIQMYNIG